MSLIQQSGIDIISLANLQVLCVDNEKVRQRIMNHPKYKIVCVPCVLIFLPNGIVEKYDGEGVFNWLQGVIDIHTYVPPPPQELPTQQRQMPPEEFYADQYESNESDEEEDNQPPQPTPKRLKKPSKKGKKSDKRYKEPEQKAATSLDDLFDETTGEPMADSNSEDETIRRQSQAVRRRAPVRSDRGNYEYDDDIFGENPQPDNRQVNNRAVRENAQDRDTKQNNIMSAAMDMQKERDKIDFGNNQNRPNITAR